MNLTVPPALGGVAAPLGYAGGAGGASRLLSASPAPGDGEDAAGTAAATPDERPSEAKLTAIKRRRAMEMATSPGKQAAMTAFMMWMSGGGLHVFSIILLGMALWQPLKALSQVNAFFAPLQSSDDEDATNGRPRLDLTLAKLVYVACCLAGLGVALYKMSQMGLLPLTSADWISLIEPRRSVDIVGGGPALLGASSRFA